MVLVLFQVRSQVSTKRRKSGGYLGINIKNVWMALGTFLLLLLLKPCRFVVQDLLRSHIFALPMFVQAGISHCKSKLVSFSIFSFLNFYYFGCLHV